MRLTAGPKCLAAATAVMVLFQTIWNIKQSYSLFSYWKNTDRDDYIQQAPTANAAIVIRTLAPVHPSTLEKILATAQELQHYKDAYDLVILVDETKVNGTAASLRVFFDESGVASLPLPRVFSVTEEMVLTEFPRLRSYLYNEPEQNVNNRTGLCCKKPPMWQFFIPIITLLMKRTHYEYAWAIENDIDVVGNQSMVQIIRDWDMALKHNETVDLVGERTTHNKVPHSNFFMKGRHTKGFAQILQRMNQNLSHAPHWTSNKDTPKWTCISDAIHRHSRRFSERLYEEISKNVYAFGECFVQPIAWDANFTMRELSRLSPSVGGLKYITGKKINKTTALKRLNSSDKMSYIYHGKL